MLEKILNDFEQENLTKINNYLETNLKKDINQTTLADSMYYSLMAGGKRLRPLLTLATMKTLNHSINEDDLRATCAIELLHTYSLIHDDLPAMDNDDLRRGMPTNHVKFGAGMATLAGDGLLSLAFQWVSDNNLSSDIKSQLTLMLSKASGPSGMVAGQASDIEFENKTLNLESLKKLHRGKTGALIHYAVSAGAVMSDSNKNLQNLLSSYADDYGLAFQIYDDILDVVATSKQLGKPVHQDDKKNTYPNLIGLKNSYTELEQVLDHSHKILNQIEENYGIDTDLLAAFLTYFKIS
ncbi:polyprenyl synthetase family protein [Apilactobacillus timberlakei]|uniref:polyprenyl synthetase family protein n=1 Tax=Apilactobacillus timberlakei TaxID=2008380 RepID=UPI00112DDD98|nr:farnesyl diphosphate synthase [Apilactobacillus timberlakei]TPR13993.1 polyprenyl synthetase family protein [Apilactobacillus timberlakei]